ncbi:hypothetical protein I3843_03G145600 [Carya illinoinensis]|uniref:Uncharacterized protein n=1 Tax=Carya illinoinensis TaxID=32201 RepID=A0A8T1R135_CARIL|nr:hypothetical protein I3760_03G144200 [Carya illinoinensis]KAG6661088.1 hypothetical protein CIPAW_03G150100 [Carya illinoinensis]KAG7987666.1 hypothetical protein I3843_03G145600 [Carya illinoinensis]
MTQISSAIFCLPSTADWPISSAVCRPKFFVSPCSSLHCKLADLLRNLPPKRQILKLVYTTLRLCHYVNSSASSLVGIHRCKLGWMKYNQGWMNTT